MVSHVNRNTVCHGNVWEQHWGKTTNMAAHDTNAVHTRALRRFWSPIFDSLAFEEKRLLDLAAGKGDLLEVLMSSGRFQPSWLPQFYSVDLSDTALQHIKMRYPTTEIVRSDCAQLPFSNNSFDIIVSQFGIEYSGLSAFDECCRVLKNDGKFIAVCHYQHGALHNECMDNLQAVNLLFEIGFFKNAHLAFDAKTSKPQTQNSIQVDSEFRDILSSVANLTNQRPYLVAGLLRKLFNDTRYMYDNLSRFEANLIIEWLDTMEKELSNYRARMAALNESSLNKGLLGNALTVFTAKGFSNVHIKELKADRYSKPFAWAVEVSK